MTSALLILIGWVGVRAQEITYNLEPTHELGPELWSIPIGGRLTMSADGTRMLVASIADSAFFLVDVETGEYRRLSQPYYQDNTFGYTFYAVDNDLTSLTTRNVYTEGRVLNAWDIGADTLISSIPTQIGSKLNGVSLRYRRIIYNAQMLDLDTQEKIASHDLMYAPAWFDGDRGVFYCSRDRVVGEFDAVTGELKRTWGVRSLESEVRRPSDSDWLYVFSLQTDFANPQNWVEAINLVTGERMTFEEYFWDRVDGQPEYREVFSSFSGSNTGSIWRGINGVHLNPVWYASAEDQSTQVVIDVEFVIDGRSRSKIMAVTPTLSKVVHCRNTNFRSGTICNALVPVSTSIGDEPPDGDEGDSVPFTLSVIGDDLHINPLQPGYLVLHVDIASIDGAVILQQDITDPVLPVRIPIGHLASGTYVCSVQTSVGRFSSTFAIRR